MVPIARPSSGAKLWRVWDKDRAEDRGQDKPEWLLAYGYRVPLYALFFSILSAFHIGWKELSIGNWIARLNPSEYTLKATGWVRTVSGVQSLISVYLLALAILTRLKQRANVTHWEYYVLNYELCDVVPARGRSTTAFHKRLNLFANFGQP